MYPNVEQPKRLWIPGQFPGMNNIIDARARSVKIGRKRFDRYQSMKKSWHKTIALYAKAQAVGRLPPAHFTFLHFEQNRQRDPDNFCAGAHKLLLDALQDIEALKNDGWSQILGLRDFWRVRNEKPGLALLITAEPLEEVAAFELEQDLERRYQTKKANRHHHGDEKREEQDGPDGGEPSEASGELPGSVH